MIALLILIAFTFLVLIFGSVYMYSFYLSSKSRSTVVAQTQHAIVHTTEGEEGLQTSEKSQAIGSQPKLKQTRSPKANQLSQTARDQAFSTPRVGQAMQVVPVPSRQVLPNVPGRGQPAFSASNGMVQGEFRIENSMGKNATTNLQIQSFGYFPAAQPLSTNMNSMANHHHPNVQPVAWNLRNVTSGPFQASGTFGMRNSMTNSASTGFRIQSFGGFTNLQPAPVNPINQGQFPTPQARIEVWRSLEINSSMIQKGSLLGKGSYAEVFEGVYHGMHGKVKCAVKVYRQMQKARNEAMEEIKIMGKDILMKSSDDRLSDIHGTHIYYAPNSGRYSIPKTPLHLAAFSLVALPAANADRTGRGRLNFLLQRLYQWLALL